MFSILKQVQDYAKESLQAAKYIGQGLSVTFDHMQRRPITVQYPYEKLVPSERYRGRIHFEFDKCIACEVCVRVCPINLPVVDWEFDKQVKKKKLNHYSIDFGVCIFCGNCVEYCPTNCLSMTEEYELASYDRHELNYDNVALGRLPYKVTQDPMNLLICPREKLIRTVCPKDHNALVNAPRKFSKNLRQLNQKKKWQVNKQLNNQ
jgi:NAD(P)H-quinone oxidoreductase subunit I